MKGVVAILKENTLFTERKEMEMSVGDRIKDLRKRRGWTLQQLADMVKISVSFLSDIEHGKSRPSLDRLRELADGLGTTTSYLLGETEDEKRSTALELSGLLAVPGFAEVVEELKGFAGWSDLDKRELLAYLSAKRIARSKGK